MGPADCIFAADERCLSAGTQIPGPEGFVRSDASYVPDGQAGKGSDRIP